MMEKELRTLTLHIERETSNMPRLLQLLLNAIRSIVVFFVVLAFTVVGTIIGSTIACVWCVCIAALGRGVLGLPMMIVLPLVVIPAIASIFIPTIAPAAIYCGMPPPAVFGVRIANLLSRAHSMRLSTSLAVLGTSVAVILGLFGVLYGSFPEIIKYLNHLLSQ